MIRPYHERDCETVLDIWYRASRVGHPFISDAELRRQREEIRTVYIPKAAQWLAEIDGRVAGFIAMLGNFIGGLFVDPGFHRRGVASSLVDFVRRSQPCLTVEVFRDNHIGRAFYEHCGFVLLRELTNENTGLPAMILEIGGEASATE